MKRKTWIIAGLTVLVCIILVLSFNHFSRTEISDIIEQNGYRITAQTEESMEITIQKKDLSKECFTSEGHEFKENEIILYQDEINTIYLEKVMYDDEDWEYLYFGIVFSYNIPEAGTLMVPYRISMEDHKVKDYTMSGTLMSKDVQDRGSFYADSAYFRGQGFGERVAVCIKSDVVHQSEECITIQLGGINHVTYMED